MQETLKQIWQMIVDSHLLNVIGAVAILVFGWLIALVASRKISRLVRRLTGSQATLPDGTAVPVGGSETLAGKVVYYVIIVFTLLGCFSVLKLYAAAAPLKDFASEVATYAPNIVGAALLTLIAWIVAGVVRAVVRSALAKKRFSERLAQQIGASDQDHIADYASKTAYYVVFLFFLPAILKALRIYGITEPLQSMFEKLMTYIPNLIAAAAILAIGLLVANIVRKAVSGLVIISRLNALGENLGVSRIFGNGGLAAMAGIVAYILVAIPVVISALTALQIRVLSDSVAGFFNKLLNATGDVVGASLIIFIAVLAGGFAASLVTRLTADFGLDKFVSDLGFRSSGHEKNAPSVIVGKLAFITVIVMAALAACETLNFMRLAEIIKRFVNFGGNVLLSIVVLLLGIWLSRFAASLVSGKCGDLVTGGVRLVVIVLTAALAIGNLNIGGAVLEIAFALIVGSVCVASAIAFGFGGREAAATLLNSWLEKLNRK